MAPKMNEVEAGRAALHRAFPDTMDRLYVVESIIDEMGTAHRLGLDDEWLKRDYFSDDGGYPQNAKIKPHFRAVLAYIRSI